MKLLSIIKAKFFKGHKQKSEDAMAIRRAKAIAIMNSRTWLSRDEMGGESRNKQA